MQIVLQIENTYEAEPGSRRLKRVTIPTRVEAQIAPPPNSKDGEEWTQWLDENILPHTGTGRSEGDAWYDVKVIECEDPTLVGREFSFGY